MGGVSGPILSASDKDGAAEAVCVCVGGAGVSVCVFLYILCSEGQSVLFMCKVSL